MDFKKGIVILCILTLTVSTLLPVLSATATDSRLTATSITFDGPGYDISIVENAPKGATVQTATMDITGQMRPGGDVTTTYDFSDQGQSKAYVGGDTFTPPFKTPAQLSLVEFTNQDYSDVNTSDNARVDSYYNLQMSCQCTGSYNFFNFKVVEDNPTQIDVSWEGFAGLYSSSGPGGVWDFTAMLYIYNYSAAAWVHLSKVTQRFNNTEATLTGSLIGNATDFMNGAKDISVLAKSKTAFWLDGTEKSEIHSDYVKIDVTINIPDSWPLDPTLDVGNDNDVQWQVSGVFQTTVNVDIKTELQSLIDAAGGGVGTVPIVLNFTSASAGKIAIDNIDIQYKIGAPPIWTVVDGPEMDEDGQGDMILDLLGFVTDDGPDNELTFTIVSNSNSTDIPLTIATDGHSLNAAPVPDWWGETTVTVKVTDGDAYPVDSEPFKITVNPVNDAPVLEQIPDRTIKQGETLTLTAVATDVDSELDPTENMFFTDDTQLFDIGRDTGEIEFVASAHTIGDHTVNISVSDGLLSDTRSFAIHVQNVNDPPTMGTLMDKTAYEDKEFTMTIEADDQDLDLGDNLHFSDDSDLFDISEGTGVISFTPVQDDIGVYQIVITVKDNSGASVSDTFELTVLNTNDAPIIDPIGDVSLERHGTFDHVVTAQDDDLEVDDDERLTFTVDNDLIDINSTTGHVTFTPVKGDVGEHSVTVTVFDSSGAEASVTFNITVTWFNNPPTATILTDNNKTSFIHKKVVRLTADAEDKDGDELNYTWMMDGKVIGHGETIDLEDLDRGTHNITLVVTDGEDSVTTYKDIKVKKDMDKGAGSVIPGFDGVAVASAFGLVGVLTFFRRRDRGR